MEKSAAQLTVERILGDAEAASLMASLQHEAHRTVSLRVRGKARKTGIWFSFPYLYTDFPSVRLVEARGGGEWADRTEFLWTALATLLVDDPQTIAGPQRCISLWAAGRTSRLSRLHRKGFSPAKYGGP